MSYLETHEQAEWVYYRLNSNLVSGNVKRSNNFREDKSIRTGSANLSDYKYSGYDRGHLAPAGDMKSSNTGMSESFFMSNISPQTPSFNRGGWKKLESFEISNIGFTPRDILYTIKSINFILEIDFEK